MRMKKVCEETMLTERAVRLYLKKKLLTPSHKDGLIDFTAEDVQKLKNIALLRRMDFTIEQIAGMLQDPAAIPSTLALRCEQAKDNAEKEKKVSSVLRELDPVRIPDVSALAAQIRSVQKPSPTMAFGRFDEVDEVVGQEPGAAMQAMERRNSRKKRLVVVLGAALIIGMLYAGFMAYPRISGFISTGPLRVVAWHENQTVTVELLSDEVVERLGADMLTVPYQSYRGRFAVGDTVEHGCQLAIELRNGDLASLGVNPLMTLHTLDAGVNTAWMKHILHRLFEDETGSRAVLWIYEPCNLKPLFWWEAQ